MALVFQPEVQEPLSLELEVSLAFYRAEDEKFWGPYQSFPRNPDDDDWYIRLPFAQWQRDYANGNLRRHLQRFHQVYLEK